MVKKCLNKNCQWYGTTMVGEYCNSCKSRLVEINEGVIKVQEAGISSKNSYSNTIKSDVVTVTPQKTTVNVVVSQNVFDPKAFAPFPKTPIESLRDKAAASITKKASADKIKCPHCGAEQSSIDATCFFCGKPLKGTYRSQEEVAASVKALKDKSKSPILKKIVKVILGKPNGLTNNHDSSSNPNEFTPTQRMAYDIFVVRLKKEHRFWSSDKIKDEAKKMAVKKYPVIDDSKERIEDVEKRLMQKERILFNGLKKQFCTKCGNRLLNDKAKFCTKCGTKL